MSAPKLVVIAALEREVSTLVRGWKATTVTTHGRGIRIYESGQALVACGGIGAIAARIAADATYQFARGNVGGFISAGFAGALTRELKVGDIVQPETVVSDSDGTYASCASGTGLLVSAGAIAGASIKQVFAEKYHPEAVAVDMEAYSVADVARLYGLPCIAIKAISDEFAFPMPPLGRFVDDAGQFRTAGFVLYTLWRPWMWPVVIKLGANSGRAAMNLCRALQQAIERYGSACLYNSYIPETMPQSKIAPGKNR